MKNAIFLDRDGVINRCDVRGGRPYAPLDLTPDLIYPDVPAALTELRAQGYLLVVATNQPDVANGKAQRCAIEAFHQDVVMPLGVHHIKVCYHNQEAACHCRKPAPGMLLEAAAAWGIDLSRSIMVGDRWRDMDAGTAAGCQTIFVDRGYQEQPPKNSPDLVIHEMGQLVAAVAQLAGKASQTAAATQPLGLSEQPPGA